MKSKFILSGGGGYVSSRGDFDFYREIGTAFEDKPVINVLNLAYACFTEKTEIKVQEKMSLFTLRELKLNIEWVNPHLTFDVVRAPLLPFVNINFLSSAIKGADIIFAHGGNGDYLQAALQSVDAQGYSINLAKLVENDKVCAGYSAGANVWSDCYYSNDNSKVCDGLGIIPIKTFCHYSWEKYRQLNELVKRKPGLPIFPLTNDAYINYSIED